MTVPLKHSKCSYLEYLAKVLLSMYVLKWVNYWSEIVGTSRHLTSVVKYMWLWLFLLSHTYSFKQYFFEQRLQGYKDESDRDFSLKVLTFNWCSDWNVMNLNTSNKFIRKKQTTWYYLIKKKEKYRIQKRLVEVEAFSLSFDEWVGFSHFETNKKGYFC